MLPQSTTIMPVREPGTHSFEVHMIIIREQLEEVRGEIQFGGCDQSPLFIARRMLHIFKPYWILPSCVLCKRCT